MIDVQQCDSQRHQSICNTDGDFIADTSLAAKKMADPAQADREGFECGEDIESPTPRPKRPARSSFRFQ